MLVQEIQTDTMRALSKIVAFILNNFVPALSYDQRIFREKRDVLRQITSPTISLSRKKRILERYNRLIPRLLRDHYIINTCIYELKQSLDLVRVENTYFASRNEIVTLKVCTVFPIILALVCGT